MGWWTRTWHNKGSGDLLLNSPDGWVIDQPQLHWLGPDNLTALLAQHTGQPFGSPAAAAQTIESQGGGFPAVTRATSLIVDTLSGVPWELHKGIETSPAPRWISDPQLARPDGRLTDWSAEGVSPLSNVSFWAEVLISALWYGDAFVWVPARDLAGAPDPPVIHPPPVVGGRRHGRIHRPRPTPSRVLGQDRGQRLGTPLTIRGDPRSRNGTVLGRQGTGRNHRTPQRLDRGGKSTRLLNRDLYRGSSRGLLESVQSRTSTDPKRRRSNKSGWNNTVPGDGQSPSSTQPPSLSPSNSHPSPPN